jgi:pyridoxine 5-phosphate synthase
VPDSEGQFTSDHGWRFPQDAERLRPLIAEATPLGVRVSLFMDPDPEQMALRGRWAQTGWSCTPSPMPRAWGTPSRSRAAGALCRRRQAALRCRPGRQRRP